MKGIVIALAAGWAFSSLAIPVREAKSLSWVVADGDKISVKTELYEELAKKCDLQFKARSPHPMLNPSKKVSEWKGLGFKSVVEKFGRKTSGKEEITLIAADGYAAQLEVDDLTRPEGMVAIFQDGQLLEPKRGGPQSMFPGLDPNIPPDMLCDCWGVWYLTGVILGDLPPVLTVNDGKKSRSVKITPGPGSKTGARPYRTPPGHFKFIRSGKETRTTRNAAVTYEPLTTLLKERFGITPKSLVVDTYYGKEIPLDNLNDWQVEYRWQGKPITAKVGGPFHLCHSQRTSDCIFFVRELKVP